MQKFKEGDRVTVIKPNDLQSETAVCSTSNARNSWVSAMDGTVGEIVTLTCFNMNYGWNIVSPTGREYCYLEDWLEIATPKCIEFTCNKCGTIHFGYTRAAAEKSIDEFNTHFETLSLTQQGCYYDNQRASMSSYESCKQCGNHYTDFRLTRSDEGVIGCTISPILFFYE